MGGGAVAGGLPPGVALGGGALAGAPAESLLAGGGVGFGSAGELEGGGAAGCEAFAGGIAFAGGVPFPGAGGVVGVTGGLAGVACRGTVGGATGCALWTTTRTFSTSESISSTEKSVAPLDRRDEHVGARTRLHVVSIGTQLRVERASNVAGNTGLVGPGSHTTP